MTVIACVRNTFLDFAEAEEGDEAQPRVVKAQTDSLAFGLPASHDCTAFAYGKSNSEPAAGSAEESRADQTAAASARPQPPQVAEDCTQETASSAGAQLAAAVEADLLQAEPAAPAAGQSFGSQPQELGVQVRVKNTFLEFVEESDGEDEPQGRIICSSTGPAALLRVPALEELGRDGVREAFQHGPVASEGVSAEVAGDASVAAAEEEQDKPPAADDEAPPRPAAIGIRAEGRTPPPARAQSGGEQTTLMLRNLPNDYSRDMILELLDGAGFSGRYDFIYYPTDFARNAGLGYAFVNMLSAADARRVGAALEGFRSWSVPSSKVCSIGWNVPCQGLEANVERYRNSPIMHRCVPDEFKPATFRDGRRVPFPKPTRKVRRPDGRWNGC